MSFIEVRHEPRKACTEHPVVTVHGEKVYNTDIIFSMEHTKMEDSSKNTTDVIDLITVRDKDVDYLEKLLDKKLKCAHVLATLHSDGKIKETIDYIKIKEAYARAHEIRKFEIELYWKRANHFWLFMTALAALFGFSIQSKIVIFQFTSPLVAILGFIFGLAFYSANQGSKYWQENWEKNLDKLEFYVSGDLYKITAILDIPKPSVSRINLYISKLVFFSWIFAFICSVTFIYTQTINSVDKNLLLVIYLTCAFILSIHSLFEMRSTSTNPSSNTEFKKRMF